MSRDGQSFAPPGSCSEAVCITCSDEGRTAEIREMLDASTARAWCDGVIETVDVTLVEPVVPGDLVLVHAGVAISTVERRTQ